MYRKLLFHFIALTLVTSAINAQNRSVRIYGSAPEYKDYAIVFRHFQNFINHRQEELFTIEVDDNGAFEFSFPLEETTYAFADIGRFRGFIYLTPGQEYHIKLPPFKPLSQSQKLNPFFKHEQVVIGILNEDSNGLNAKIRDFDQAFNRKLNKYAVKLLTTKNKSLAQGVIDSLETDFPSDNDFFREHKHFRYARLAMLASRNKEQDVIKKYFSDKPVQFNMPAYWTTFKEVFNGYCHTFFSEHHFQRALSYRSVRDSIRSRDLFHRPDFSEALALWIIYEGYHEKILSQKVALHLLKQCADNSGQKRISKTAAALHDRIGILMEGKDAPGFTLPDFSGQEKTLKDFEGKFVYLNFLHTENYACRKDMKLLEKIQEDFRQNLHIVTIVVNEDFDQAKQFLEANKNTLNWHFLYFAMQGNLINNYNVQAVPLYYLIDPHGKLVMVPAPAPGENFQDAFIDQFKKFRRELLRKNSQ
jgi:peroxiredoxin